MTRKNTNKKTKNDSLHSWHSVTKNPAALAAPVTHTGKEPVFAHVPDSVAVAAMQGKVAMLPAAFRSLLPELRARAFTVSGVQCLATIERVQKRVVEIQRDGQGRKTAGRDWATVREEIAGELRESLGDGAEARAQLLLRTHGFQAYATARHQEQEAHADILPFWQYVTCGDKSVRESHAALDGRVFKSDDEFWNDHYPPWDWGCRCIVIALMPEEVDAMKAADAGLPPVARRVLEGRALEAAREGLVSRGVGRLDPLDVRAPGPGGYNWHPTHQRLKLSDIHYPPELLGPMIERWQGIDIGDGRSVYEWLTGKTRTHGRTRTGTDGHGHTDGHGQEPPTPEPADKPVSDAIKVAARDKVVGKSAGIALDAIAKVHTDGNLPKLTLTRNDGLDALGQYSARKANPGKSPKIQINGKGKDTAFTTAHEVGHFLDHQGLSPKTAKDGFASDARGKDPAMDKLMDALRESSAFKQIERSGLRDSDKSYLMRDRELFARAYAQYVAVQSKDREMMNGLNRERLGHTPFTQWDDRDFYPIKNAMTELFKTRGWVK